MILLDLDGNIKGDSVVQGHEDWITIDNCSFSVARSISTSGGGKDRETSNPSFTEVSLEKSADKTSPDLFSQAAGGKQLGMATLVFIQQSEGEPQVYMKVEMEKPIISSYQLGSSGDRPIEVITINFIKMKVHYWQFEEGDKVTEISPRGWDLAANAKWD